MADETIKRKPAKRGGGKAASATRAERASETITIGTEPLTELPTVTRSKYPWHSLVQTGSYFVIAGATAKRQLQPPKNCGFGVVQVVKDDGLWVIRK